ncbi:ATP-binding protein [Roseibacterium sp. SDUM158016]|uniref:AAA family ATPase n=1 Tax=Roseicyclus sediminis TaxID=2980997 RepID=UPI0021D22005|nr:ATP-binding protein [Roseibacterium sp. SDUM158016]MCU4654797.1 ATP-binding protein [Roseibacterium sp. SDUM158016]
MLDTAPTLHMLCGKIAAGKSTLAASLASAPGTVLIAEDDWLNALFADELVSLPDYVRCSSKLRRIMAPHVAAVLNAGASIVLDFPANTVEQRRWMRGILANTTAADQLHQLDAPDEVCLARLRARNSQGDHPFAVTEAQFRQFSSHFVAPTRDEGFNVVRHEASG